MQPKLANSQGKPLFLGQGQFWRIFFVVLCLAIPTAIWAQLQPEGVRPNAGVVSSGQAEASTATVEPQVAVGPVYATSPELTPAQLDALERATEESHRPTPVPPGDRNPIVSPPADPPTALTDPVQAMADLTVQAATDFAVQRSHDLTEISTSQRSMVHEPSLGNMGDTIFFTANWYAAKSTDGGQSFTYVNPYTTFPSINGGFCCDQIVHYAPAQDMMIWALQYVKDSTTGTLRIARAVGSAAVAANNWIYYDFNPQFFGFATGNWMDFPNLTVSSNYLYATSNVFTTSSDSFTGSVIWRIPLTQLAAGGGISVDYFTRTDVGSIRSTEGATTTMYWAAFTTTTNIRIHRWDDGSGTIFWDNVGVNPFTWLNRDGVATSPDGTNWAARADSRILGAWRANSVLGFMWMAKQDGSFPYPYTIIARFSESTRALLTQNPIWHPDYAWMYPTVSPNAAGNLAGLIYFGGGSTYPTAQYWIVDDVQPNFVPLPVYFAAASAAGPVGNRWGDYVTVRKHKQYPNSWVGGLYYMGAGGQNSNAVGRYAWFGRVRDLPSTNSPPSSVSVSPSSGSGSSQTFSFLYSDPDGFADLNLMVTMINSTFGMANGCVTFYARASNQLFLMNDAGTTTLGPGTVGGAGTLQNSQCTVNLPSSSVLTSGNNLTLNLALSFTAAFGGTKAVQMIAVDVGGLNSGWQMRGIWTVPGSPPLAVSVTPASGSGANQTFGLLYSDPNGFNDLNFVVTMINSTFSFANGCVTFYFQAANQLYLVNDAGTASLGPGTVGAGGTLSNSQCLVNLLTSSVLTSGNNLTLNLGTSFAPGFAGAKAVLMIALDNGGLNSGWQIRGTWTVP
ncbi:MAG: hypothetical protein HY647_11935 [Acidobacteria bacterium]|nr:hypothetical protein [Acidobacteriota bacterium]